MFNFDRLGHKNNGRTGKIGGSESAGDNGWDVIDDSSTEWENLGSDGESDPSLGSEDEIIRGTERAEQYAREFNSAVAAGNEEAEKIIARLKSGELSHEEALNILGEYEGKIAEYEKSISDAAAASMEAEEEREKDGRRGLLERINRHPIAKKVVSGILAIGIAAGGLAISRRIMNSKGVDFFSTTAYAEYYDGSGSSGNINGNTNTEQHDINDEIGVSDGFETMANGVTYAKDAYSDARRDRMYDFTNGFQEGYGNEEQTREALIDAVTKDPIYLAAIFSRLPDNFKGEYAGMTSTVLANMINGENGASLQKYMLDTIKDVVEKSEFDFGTLNIGNGGYNEYEIRDKGNESTPANVRLAARSLRESDNGRFMITVSLEDGEVWLIYLEECGNIIETTPSMKEDGHAELTQKDTETPISKDSKEGDDSSTEPEEEESEEEPEEEKPEEEPEEEKPEEEPEEEKSGEDIKSKDKEKLKGIDEGTKEDIESDIGTDEFVINLTEDVVEKEGEATETPINIEGGTGTEHGKFEQSEDSDAAEQIDQKQTGGDGNGYSDDLGGAHNDEYTPVEDNPVAQAEADKKAGLDGDQEAARDMTGDEFEDILSDLGLKEKEENENKKILFNT